MSDALPNRRGKGVRILSLCLPRLSTDRLLRAEWGGSATASGTHPEKQPLAIVEKIRGAQRIVAVDQIAARRGIRIGAGLADARAAHPDICVAEADAAADRRLLEAVADWCDRYTPLVALDPPDGLFLDISGCSHLFAGPGSNGDGEAALIADCLGRLGAQGFVVDGAIASTAGAAWAVARFGKSGIIPVGAEAEAVADLPVAALRIAPDERALLERLGLKRIGQLIGRPRAPLAARFGIELIRRLDQALGHEDETLSPRRPAPQLLAERRFLDPVAEEDALLETLGSLARALAPALESRGIGARVLEATFFRIDGAVPRLVLGTASPLRDPEAISALFRERLASLGQEWDAGFGFDMLRLAVVETERLDETQVDLSGEGANGLDFVRLVDRLGARLGEVRITRFEAVDTHIPERAVRATPLASAGFGVSQGSLSAKGNGNLPFEAGHSYLIEEKSSSPLWEGAKGGVVNAARDDERSLTQPRTRLRRDFEDRQPVSLSETPPDRPLKLFARPEPVEVIAEVPEGPPLKFRWRRVVHEVARAEGPERIAAEWWRPEDAESATRDYFRVEDSQGRRYWLFRAGLYGRETVHPVWFVHGLFA